MFFNISMHFLIIVISFLKDHLLNNKFIIYIYIYCNIVKDIFLFRTLKNYNEILKNLNFAYKTFLCVWGERESLNTYRNKLDAHLLFHFLHPKNGSNYYTLLYQLIHNNKWINHSLIRMKYITYDLRYAHMSIGEKHKRSHVDRDCDLYRINR